MKNIRLDNYSARARSDPSLPAGVRGDPQWISALRIDPPERFGARGHPHETEISREVFSAKYVSWDNPPEVWHTRNGPPADSTRGKPTCIWESQPCISFRTLLIQGEVLPLDSDERVVALPKSSVGTTFKNTRVKPCGSS